MASISIAHRPTESRPVSLKESRFLIGRTSDCDLVLRNPAVSRQHASIVNVAGSFVLEDLGSSNGTLLNGKRIQHREVLRSGDMIQVGGIDLRFQEYEEGLQVVPTDELAESPTDSGDLSAARVLAVLDAGTSLRAEQNAEAKLRAIAELSRNLGQSLDLDELLSRVLESTLQVFPQADLATVVLSEDGKNLVPHAIRSRHPERGMLETIQPISRTVARRVLSEGVAVLSSNVQADERFAQSRSILEFGIRSVMCAPLIGSASRALGLLTVDSQALESAFNETDLDVLVSLGRLCAQSIQFARLHETLVAERGQTARAMATAAAEREELQEQLLSIAEQEQQRIGQELHDDVGQELTALSLLLETLTTGLSREGSVHADLSRRLGQQSLQTLRKVRALSHGLTPVALQLEDLRPALESLVEQINEMRGKVCRFWCEGPIPIADAGIATQLYRIAQEAITNAVKHSQAEHIDVRLSRRAESIMMTVRDDGVGISHQEQEPTGLGLRTMRHRAALIGAELTIGVRDKGGTIVRCTVVIPATNQSSRPLAGCAELRG